MPFTNIVCIEDDPLWAAVLAKALIDSGLVSHVCCAPTARIGLELCCEKQPQVVILDLWLPDNDGLDVAGHLSTRPHPPKIVIVTARLDEATLWCASAPHISGMLWKDTHIRENLRASLGAMLSDHKYFPCNVQMAMDAVRRLPDAFFKILSDRELALIPLLASGKGNAEVAVIHGIEPVTVKSHREHIMRKLGLHSTVELIRWGIEKGFVQTKQFAPVAQLGPS